MRAAIAEVEPTNFSCIRDLPEYSRGIGYSQFGLTCQAKLGETSISWTEEMVAIPPVRTLLLKMLIHVLTRPYGNGGVFSWAQEPNLVPARPNPYFYLAINSRVLGYRASMEGTLVSGKLTAQAISGSRGSTVGGSATALVG